MNPYAVPLAVAFVATIVAAVWILQTAWTKYLERKELVRHIKNTRKKTVTLNG